ncbi:hypothetical protein C8R46DRAFT_1025953 [Mycena filopes]|nr:hypothetical protein C8R46DRAFT_1025953 [Mycena filopes]
MATSVLLPFHLGEGQNLKPWGHVIDLESAISLTLNSGDWGARGEIKEIKDDALLAARVGAVAAATRRVVAAVFAAASAAVRLSSAERGRHLLAKGGGILQKLDRVEAHAVYAPGAVKRNFGGWGVERRFAMSRPTDYPERASLANGSTRTGSEPALRTREVYVGFCRRYHNQFKSAV